MILIHNEDGTKTVVGSFPVDLTLLGFLEQTRALRMRPSAYVRVLLGHACIVSCKLSRGAKWEDMQRSYPELRGVPLFRGEDDSVVVRLLELCNPRKDTSESDALLAQEGRDIRALLQEELR